MSSAAALRRRIRALAELDCIVIDGSRQLCRDAGSANAAFATEIMETHLGRSLEFRNDSGMIRFAVRSGRVLSVLDATRGNDDCVECLNVAIWPSNEATIAQAAVLCRRFLSGAGGLYVKSTPLPIELEDTCPGIPPNLLIPARAGDEMPRWLKELLELTDKHVVVIAGDTTSDTGNDPITQKLRGLAEIELHDPTFAAPIEDRCTMIVLTDAPGSLLFCATRGAVLVFATALNASANQLLACWAALDTAA